ncbi:adenylate kinase isoenzyme 5 isoform X2 [Lutzomyia longipalpis]|uniref:adenylate kinase isoenzyme 5 isoform X2 n=1 Tax=Lutzomyia longipalpis TaxID=7200 RepID=UPI002483B034|nr:adenylate kinase isoenzyme 5 isoform X2 [Lutzomyia longipalpis]
MKWIMGICLDTEANSAAQDAEDVGADWKGGGRRRSTMLHTPLSGNFPMQNAGKVKFDPPKVPVIFVLGGPGSGKVTHCDTLMQEKRGVVHINMMDLLQQYAIGNDMQDFSQLSSKTVTEVLMLEMKMAPAAKAYLVSGFPRSMRDVVEYSEKIQVVNGVVLISWRQAVLQKQIDYGAKLGHVVLSLAKMELENFFKNVMPVADYFDQSDLLLAVNGERSPTEVYKDFREAVLEILGAQENQEALLNGIAGMGRGSNEIPGSIVSVETAPGHSKVVTVDNATYERDDKPHQEALTERTQRLDIIPPVIFIIGGPGSNKASLCVKAIGINPGWGHISIGRLFRSVAESEAKPNTEAFTVKEAIAGGELVSNTIIERLLQDNFVKLRDKKGILVDGYPRDLEQLSSFEEKFKQNPQIILLDCSKLQLGRGRLDDTVSSFRRRLELFREKTLPMLKQIDTTGRLTIIDGDTDSPSVAREFERIVRQLIQTIEEKTRQEKYVAGTTTTVGQLYGVSQRNQIQNHPPMDDFNTAPGVVPTISGQMDDQRNRPLNGHIPNEKPNLRAMLRDANDYPLDSHI